MSMMSSRRTERYNRCKHNKTKHKKTLNAESWPRGRDTYYYYHHYHYYHYYTTTTGEGKEEIHDDYNE